LKTLSRFLTFSILVHESPLHTIATLA